MPDSALVVGAAPAPAEDGFYRELLARAEFVIGADAGARMCLRLGRVPDLAVGDFDSADPALLSDLAAAGVPVERHPSAKDESDLDISVAAARARGKRTIALTAAFTDRIDHTLAAIGAFLRCADDATCSIEEPSFIAHVLSAEGRAQIDLSVPVGGTISVVALGGRAIVSSGGLRYPLADTMLEPMSSLGLSNQASAPTQHVRVASGTVTVILFRVPHA